MEICDIADAIRMPLGCGNAATCAKPSSPSDCEASISNRASTAPTRAVGGAAFLIVA